MSEENEGEENNQNDLLTELDDFEFYFRFIKPLVLELPTEEDRGIGAAWAQKLEQIPETEEERQQRLNYVKLLLFVLQRGRLSGIFKKQPPSGPLQPFPQGFSILDMGNWMLDQEDAQTCGGGDAGRVPYEIEISNDLREYAASQEIPNFGVQMYYAWSSEDPVNKWLLFDEDKFPQYILDKIKQLNEIRSDEKTTILKDGCITRKKGCELNFSEKYSRKRVKSPQEIEKSQGRSFHTYMGLVGRMGNFNDKCDDDPEKYQRQEQRKGKCPKKSSAEKRCVANAGEAEDMAGEEEYDNLVTGLGGGGLNSINRPCLCPYPFPQQNCPEHQAKGGLQPFENQQSPFVVRGNTENFQYTGGRNVPKSSGGQCPEHNSFQPLSTMRNVPRQRSESPNLPNLNCPPEDDPRDCQNQTGVCICSNPPCTCPCPRGGTQGQTRPNTTPAAGGVCPEQGRTFDRTSRSDQTGGRRDVGPGLTSFRAPDPCTPMPSRPDISPVGGRTGATTGLRPVNAEVIHCYDSQNPDPALTQTLSKTTDWIQCGSSFKFADTNFKIAQERISLIASARDNRSDLSSRRVLFENQPQDQNLAGDCQQPGGVQNISPLGTDPICENSSPEAAYERLPPRSNQTTLLQQQTTHNFQDCENPVGDAALQPMTRPTSQSLYDTNTQDFQKMVEFLKKYKQIAKDDTCTRESQQGQVCPPQPRAAQVCKQQPRPTQACLPQSQPAHRLAQVSSQQPRTTQACSPQSQPLQMSSQQPRTTQVCSPQSQPPQVCSQQSRPAKVCSPQSQPAQVCPQQPRHDQVCPQQPQLAQMSPQQPRRDQVCSQQPQLAQMSPQQPRRDQVCSQQPQLAQMSPQQPQLAQMSPQQPRRDQVCPQQPQSSHVCSQQAQPAHVCSQQLRSPQTCQQSHQSAQACSPQPVLRGQVCPQPQLSQMYPQQQQASPVCSQQPQLTQMYPQQLQSPQMCRSMPQPTQMLQQTPRPSQVWPQQSRPAEMWSQQSRPSRPGFQEVFEECTLQCHSPQGNAQSSQGPQTTWQEPKVGAIIWHEFPEGNSLCQSTQSRLQSPQPGQGRSQSPQSASVYPTPLQTGHAPQDGCNYPQQSQTLSPAFCPRRETDQQHECDAACNITDNSAAQSVIYLNDTTLRDAEEEYLNFCKDINDRQRRTGQQIESTRIGASEQQAPGCLDNAQERYRQNFNPSHFNRHRAFQQEAEVNFPQQNVNAFQPHMGQDCEPLMSTSGKGSPKGRVTPDSSRQSNRSTSPNSSTLKTTEGQCGSEIRQGYPSTVPSDLPSDIGTICEPQACETYTYPRNPDAVRRHDLTETMCENPDDDWFF